MKCGDSQVATAACRRMGSPTTMNGRTDDPRPSRSYFFCKLHSHLSVGGLVLHTLQLSTGPDPAEQTPQTNRGGVRTIFLSAPCRTSLLGPQV